MFKPIEPSDITDDMVYQVMNSVDIYYSEWDDMGIDDIKDIIATSYNVVISKTEKTKWETGYESMFKDMTPKKKNKRKICSRCQNYYGDLCCISYRCDCPCHYSSIPTECIIYVDG